MRVSIISGPPAVGKTSIITHTLKNLQNKGAKTAVVKLDSLIGNDEDLYRKEGIDVIVGLSKYICPDHYLATNISKIIEYHEKLRLDYLVIESAGLCNRCSPHITKILAITVLDMLSGIHAPYKIGPMLKNADCILLSRGDLISQAEREIYRLRISEINPIARIVEVNGLTGQGSALVERILKSANVFNQNGAMRLRHTMPSAICSFCLGEKRVGIPFASGNIRKMEFPQIEIQEEL